MNSQKLKILTCYLDVYDSILSYNLTEKVKQMLVIALGLKISIIYYHRVNGQ